MQLHSLSSLARKPSYLRLHSHAGVLVLLITVLVAFAGSRPAYAADHPALHSTPTVTVTPEPASTPVPHGSSNSGGPLGFLNPSHWLPDPKSWAADVFSQVLITFLRSIADGLQPAPPVPSAMVSSSRPPGPRTVAVAIRTITAMHSPPWRIISAPAALLRISAPPSLLTTMPGDTSTRFWRWPSGTGTVNPRHRRSGWSNWPVLKSVCRMSGVPPTRMSVSIVRVWWSGSMPRSASISLAPRRRSMTPLPVSLSISYSQGTWCSLPTPTALSPVLCDSNLARNKSSDYGPQSRSRWC
jgi:hypothetical protein